MIVKNRLKFLGALALSFMATACLDEFKVPLRQETEKLIVEGILTNDPANQYLRLSLTTQFGTFNNIEPVKGAYVELQASNSKTTVYRTIPGELGIYRPDDTNFKSTEGLTYTLYIKLQDGREFKSASQKMPKPVPIEKLTAVFNSNNRIGFEVSLDFKDPKETENYYRWTGRGFYQRISKGVRISFGPGVCCDRCWVLKEEKSINLYSDAIVNGGAIKGRAVYFSPFFTLGKHLVEISQYNVSKETYQFWNRYKDQQVRRGTIFDPLPAPLLGNVVNIADPSDIALGYFEVSGVSKLRIEPEALTQGLLAQNYLGPLYVPEGDCMLAYPFSVYLGVNPSNW